MYNDLNLEKIHQIPNNVPIVAYTRISTDKQFLDNQINQIESWAFNRNISKERITFIGAEISSRESLADRKLDQVFSLLGNEGIFIATEISRLGRSISEIINIIEQRLKLGNRLIFINQELDLNPHSPFNFMNNLVVNIFASVAQLERDLIFRRTKMALSTRKKNGVVLGRPKGVSSSMYDDYTDKIKEYLKADLSISAIVKLLQKDYQIGSQRSLAHFIKKHKLIAKLWKESLSE